MRKSGVYQSGEEVLIAFSEFCELTLLCKEV